MCGAFTVGPVADFTSITQALVAIRAKGMLCPIALILQPNYVSAVETFPLSFADLPTSPSKRLFIYPHAAANDLVLASNAAATVDLACARYVSFDGRPGQAGANPRLVIQNGNPDGVALRIGEDASHNVLQYLDIQGASQSDVQGVIHFPPSQTGPGSHDNVIANSRVGPVRSQPSARIRHGIYAQGAVQSLAQHHRANVIAEVQIVDVFDPVASTSAITLGAGTSDWTLRNNLIQQSVPRTFLAAQPHFGIRIDSPSGAGFLLSGNRIGGGLLSNPVAPTDFIGPDDTRWIGIRLNVAEATASSVQGNYVGKLKLQTNIANSADLLHGEPALAAIQILGGQVDVGSVTGNMLGGTPNDAIRLSPQSQLVSGVGIDVQTAGAVLIANNRISHWLSLSEQGVAGGNLIGIRVRETAMPATLLNNTIESLEAGLAGLLAGSTQLVGILKSGSNASISRTEGNHVRQLMAYSDAPDTRVYGVFVAGDTSTQRRDQVVGNLIAELRSSTRLDLSGSDGLTLAGILVSAGQESRISQNTVSHLANDSPLAAAAWVLGIAHRHARGTVIEANRVFALRLAGVENTPARRAELAGIFIESAEGQIDVQNNMISLGETEPSNLVVAGIHVGRSSTGPTLVRVRHNSVHIAGATSSGWSPSFGFLRGDFSGTPSQIAVQLYHNVIQNLRTGGNGIHYALANEIVAVPIEDHWQSDGNVLNANLIGHWISSHIEPSWQTVSNGDLRSFFQVPVHFVDTSIADLHVRGDLPQVLESAAAPSTISIDMDGQTRPGPSGSVRGGGTLPDIGADEYDGLLLDQLGPVMDMPILSDTDAPGARDLEVTIADASGLPTSPLGQPMLYWRRNNEAYQGVAAQPIGAGRYRFRFAETSQPGDTVQYYLVAQDAHSPPNLSVQPLGLGIQFLPDPPRTHFEHPEPAQYRVLAGDLRVLGNGVPIAHGDESPSLDDHTDFGVIGIAATEDRSFTVTNVGQASLSIASVTVTGMTPADFQVLSPLPTNVPAGSSHALHVRFRPTEPGWRVARVQIRSNDPDLMLYHFAIQGQARASDMQVAISNDEAQLLPGFDTVYRISVRNAGPDAAPGASIAIPLAEGLHSAAWTCSSIPVGFCPNAGGQGSITESIGAIPAAAELRYLLVANVSTTAPAFVSQSADVSTSDGRDPDIQNNQASDTDPVMPIGLFTDGFEPVSRQPESDWDSD